MLVLSRRKAEQIMIGDDICVTIVEIRGDKVRIGIDAPQQVPVHRQEIYDLIRKESADERRPDQVPETEVPTDARRDRGSNSGNQSDVG